MTCLMHEVVVDFPIEISGWFLSQGKKNKTIVKYNINKDMFESS